MSTVEVLQREHEFIERELLELETIMDEEVINYSNLVHVFKKLWKFWEAHQAKEERLFTILEDNGVSTPLAELAMERAEFSQHKKQLTDAIMSGSDAKVREALNTHGKAYMQQIRSHIQEQEWVLCALPATHVESAITAVPNGRAMYAASA